MENIELKTHKGIVRIGTRIRIIHLNNNGSPIDDSDYDGKEGTVSFFDQIPLEANPGMHGTWGGLAVYDHDDFEILTGYEDELRAFSTEDRDAREKNAGIDRMNSLIDDEVKRYEQSIEAQKKTIANLRSHQTTKWAELPSPKRVAEALARELASRLSLHPEVCGPQGPRGEYRIRLLDCAPEGMPIMDTGKHLVHKLTLTVSEDTRGTKFWYDTGETEDGTEACPAGSSGELNGFNNRRAPLPEDIEEMIKILKK